MFSIVFDNRQRTKNENYERCMKLLLFWFVVPEHTEAGFRYFCYRLAVVTTIPT